MKVISQLKVAGKTGSSRRGVSVDCVFQPFSTPSAGVVVAVGVGMDGEGLGGGGFGGGGRAWCVAFTSWRNATFAIPCGPCRFQLEFGSVSAVAVHGRCQR